MANPWMMARVFVLNIYIVLTMSWLWIFCQCLTIDMNRSHAQHLPNQVARSTGQMQIQDLEKLVPKRWWQVSEPEQGHFAYNGFVGSPCRNNDVLSPTTGQLMHDLGALPWRTSHHFDIGFEAPVNRNSMEMIVRWSQMIPKRSLIVFPEWSHNCFKIIPECFQNDPKMTANATKMMLKWRWHDSSQNIIF